MVLGGALTLLALSFITFVAGNLKSPEGVARSVLGKEASPAQIDAYVEEHELDRPVVARYADWLRRAVRGDMGRSVTTGRPVADEVLTRLSNSVILMLAAMALAVPTAVGIGAFAARRQGSWVDRLIVAGTAGLYAVPVFVVGVALALVFGVLLDWLPVSSLGLNFTSGTDRIPSFVLPGVTLALSITPYILLLSRAGFRESLLSGYTRAAALRGLRPRKVMWGYALPNAGIPICHAISASAMFIIGNSLVVESLFGFPGVGQALVEALSTGDTTTLEGGVLLLGAIVITLSVLADLAAVALNPRLRTS